MLINLTKNLKEGYRKIKISKEHNFTYIPQYDPSLNTEIGIYECSIDFNFSHNDFMEYHNMGTIPFDESYRVFYPTFHKSQYGVADNIEQVKQYFKEEIQDPDNDYFITYTKVYQDKANAGIGGGWRWHKWGEYIGNLNPICEYLDDENFGDDFEFVIVFHLYRL